MLGQKGRFPKELVPVCPTYREIYRKLRPLSLFLRIGRKNEKTSMICGMLICGMLICGMLICGMRMC